MASITTQLADFVTDTINAARPLALETTAERKPVAHVGREEAEYLLITVVAGIGATVPISRGAYETEYPVSIAIDYAINPNDNECADDMHEVVEQVCAALWAERVATIGTRQPQLMSTEPDDDESRLTDSMVASAVLIATYKDIHA